MNASAMRPDPELDWMKQAACRDHPEPDLWFPESGNATTRHAKAICAACPVRIDCLNYAVREKFQHGIWGGTTREERRKIRRLS